VPGGRSNDGAEKGWENHGKTIKNLLKIRGFLMFLVFFGLKKISSETEAYVYDPYALQCQKKGSVGWLLAIFAGAIPTCTVAIQS
jgi:hypothetical protein